MKEYFCKHLDGPVVNVVKDESQGFLSSFVTTLCNYFKNLSIADANFYHLNFIGRLMGFPRPYTPGDEIAGSYIRYSNAGNDSYPAGTTPPYTLATGYYEWSYGLPYGVFSATPEGGYGSETMPIANGNYRNLLEAVGRLKCNIVSMKAIHDICYYFLGNGDYELRQGSNPDEYTLWIGLENARSQGVALHALLTACYKGHLYIGLEFEEE